MTTGPTTALLSKTPTRLAQKSSWRPGPSKTRALAATIFSLFFLTGAEASQSLVGQKDGFNSNRQFSTITYGSVSLDESSFVGASMTYARTPEDPAILDTDTFYQGTLTIGYAVHNIAFDAGFNASRSPLQEARVLGFTFGITYVYVPEDADSDDYKDQALTALHSQIYFNEPQKPPLFWVRMGYIGNTLRSNLLPAPNSTGTEAAFSFDAYYPYSPELMLSLGASFHGYDDNNGFFDRALKNTTSSEIQLLASTIQGLPHTSIVLQATWLIVSPFDSLVPRYQATEIDSSRQWSHTIDIGWRHQFSKHWYLTPTYEVSMYQGLPSTAVLGDIVYAF